MKRSIRLSRSREYGATIVEMALVVPLLLLFIGGIVDLGRWITTHGRCTELAYEGARYAAALPDLDNASADTAQPALGCAVQCPTLAEVIERVRNLMEPSEKNPIEGRALRIIATHTAPTAGNTQDIVEVQVTLPFKPYLLSFAQFDWVHASARAPYLVGK